MGAESVCRALTAFPLCRSPARSPATSQEPLALFDALTARELDEMHAEICRRAQLDLHPERHPFWLSLRRLCEDHQARQRERGRGGHSAAAGGAAVGLHSAVSADVAGMFEGKTVVELSELRVQINEQLQVATPSLPQPLHARQPAARRLRRAARARALPCSLASLRLYAQRCAHPPPPRWHRSSRVTTASTQTIGARCSSSSSWHARERLCVRCMRR